MKHFWYIMRISFFPFLCLLMFAATDNLLVTEKHGTCAYPVIRDEYSYFSTTLQLYSEYNILVSISNNKESCLLLDT